MGKILEQGHGGDGASVHEPIPYAAEEDRVEDNQDNEKEGEAEREAAEDVNVNPKNEEEASKGKRSNHMVESEVEKHDDVDATAEAEDAMRLCV
ncbi:hypothetical protein Dimus_027381 [Dionaea muscipula]